jgi:hypothetical protein
MLRLFRFNQMQIRKQILMSKQMLHQLINQVGRRQKKLLITISSVLIFSFTTYSQVLSKEDSINFKKDLEKLLTKYGLQTAGYQINVQSNNQRGGQTAFIITNNYFSPKKREISDSLLNAIINYLPDKNFPVTMYMRNQDGESLSFCEKIKNSLHVKGYYNVFISTTNFRYDIITGDPQADLEFQRKVIIEITTQQLSNPPYKYLMIMIPANTND